MFGKEPPATLCSYTPVLSQSTLALVIIVIVVVEDVLSYVPLMIKSVPDPFAIVSHPEAKTIFPPKSMVV